MLDKRFDNIPMEQTAEILMLRKDLRELPTIQPEPPWISVSERLPEGYADVLCCNKYADMMIGMIYENSASDTRFSVESDAEIMHDVIAWMPLPAVPDLKGGCDV